VVLWINVIPEMLLFANSILEMTFRAEHCVCICIVL